MGPGDMDEGQGSGPGEKLARGNEDQVQCLRGCDRLTEPGGRGADTGG